MGREIRPGLDLIVFDEVQVSNQALSSLKYFQERANAYHIAAAGSLLGVKMSVPGSFPVGKVNFLDLHPMTFLEFLNAMGAERYRRLLMADPQPELYYWRSKGGKAELDFLCEFDREVMPMEVKAGLRSRSLRSYDQQFSPRYLIRTNLLNLKKDGKVCNLPLYAVSQFRKLITYASSGPSITAGRRDAGGTPPPPTPE